MEKIIRDGEVAVLYSPGYGAGWSSWSIEPMEVVETLLFHPILVNMVENGEQDKITEEFIENTFGIKGHYCGGARNLTIEWVPEGYQFEIEEYDGNESVHIIGQRKYFIV